MGIASNFPARPTHRKRLNWKSRSGCAVSRVNECNRDFSPTVRATLPDQPAMKEGSQFRPTTAHARTSYEAKSCCALPEQPGETLYCLGRYQWMRYALR